MTYFRLKRTIYPELILAADDMGRVFVHDSSRPFVQWVRAYTDFDGYKKYELQFFTPNEAHDMYPTAFIPALSYEHWLKHKAHYEQTKVPQKESA